MDLGLVVSLTSLILGAGVIVGATVVAIVVAKRRGLDQVDQRADNETRRLVEAQAARLLLLEAENARQAQQIATLTTKVTQLEAERNALDAAIRRLGGAPA